MTCELSDKKESINADQQKPLWLSDALMHPDLMTIFVVEQFKTLNAAAAVAGVAMTP